MGFRSGTILSADPAADLVSQIDAELVATGWVFVEQVANLPLSGDTTRVYRCPAAVNIWGADFHVYVIKSSTTWVRLASSEGWNAATKKPVRPAAATTSALAADGSLGGGADVTFSSSVPAQTLHSLVVDPTPTRYWIKVNDWGLTVATDQNGANRYHSYAGLFETLTPNELFPLVTVGSSWRATVQSQQLAWSRQRKHGSVHNTYNLNGRVFDWITATIHPSLTDVDLFLGKNVAFRVLLRKHQSAPTVNYGDLRGLLPPDYLTLNVGGATPAGSDYVTLNGTRWLLFPRIDSGRDYAVDSGVAI